MTIDTKFCCVFFCVVFEEILCSESVADWQTEWHVKCITEWHVKIVFGQSKM